MCACGSSGIATSAPTDLKTKLPSGSRRSSGAAPLVASIASTPLPTLAPSTRPRATVVGSMPCEASVDVSSTMARLEYEATVSAAPTTMSSSTSLGSATSSARTAGLSVSGFVAPTISCSASVISPRPISTRPMRPAWLFWRLMNITTPTKISSGLSHDRSNENTTAISAVPTSAPSIAASAALLVTRPLPTKLATIRQVAVLLCTTLVTPSPASAAAKRLLKLPCRMRRRFSPNTRSMPVRTMCVPQTSSAMAARRLSRWTKVGWVAQERSRLFYSSCAPHGDRCKWLDWTAMKKDLLLIGVSARIYYPAGPVLDLGGVWTKTLHYLEQSVAHWIMHGGALAVMVPAVDSHSIVTRDELNLHDYAQALDGLVLQGGNDVAPESYGETPLDPAWAGDAVRDRYEMELVDAFVQAGKPVFGICRGLQLLNVMYGGTLLQDIATQRPDSRAHRDTSIYERHVHPVVVEPGSRLQALYPGVRQATVNSIHHQAIKDLAPDFSVEARCPEDGLIEAVRWRGPSYVAAVQWHPEFHDRNEPAHFDDMPLLNDFLAAARADKA